MPEPKKRPDTPLAPTPEADFSLTSRYDKAKKNQDANEKAGRTPSGLNYYNITSGSKKNLTDAEKKSLVSQGKARNS